MQLTMPERVQLPVLSNGLLGAISYVHIISSGDEIVDEYRRLFFCLIEEDHNDNNGCNENLSAHEHNYIL